MKLEFLLKLGLLTWCLEGQLQTPCGVYLGPEWNRDTNKIQIIQMKENVPHINLAGGVGGEWLWPWIVHVDNLCCMENSHSSCPACGVGGFVLLGFPPPLFSTFCKNCQLSFKFFPLEENVIFSYLKLWCCDIGNENSKISLSIPSTAIWTYMTRGEKRRDR